MNRRAFLTTSSAAILSPLAKPQANSMSRTDGNWWKDLNNNAKYGYVVGYSDGSSKADATWAYGSCKNKVTPKYAEAVSKGNDFSGLTIGQLSQGLDEFYKDFRNTTILATDAMMIVHQQISGVPQKMIDESLETIRKTALNPNY